MPKPIGLGRGLDSLIPGATEAKVSAEDGNARGEMRGIVEIAVGEIRANPRQPRLSRGIEALKLDELAASIREHGVIQPLIVTRTQGPGAPFTLIAGERRWRAAQLAGLTHVPAIIKEAAPQDMLELALIENIQRSDLSPLEEAAAYQQLINEFGLTQEQVAERVGKSRVAITNTVRLLKLPGQAQAALMQGVISEGHARALLSLSSSIDQLAALDQIVARGLNVRQTEELVRRMTQPISAATHSNGHTAQRWEGAKEYESKLRAALGTRVSLQRSRKGGRIVIEFYSDEEFASIYERIVGAES
ncbi:MAG: ParB/RepB/Spo0J family partition protein [Anaerolineae bacterium]|nr:ParB/RepB/Spo0J family partition protein [Thermoflexales bacterium]MDW8407969.1 ParB/RepB/Spo0J family partition protein [Anaerolineae bacterium]